MRIVEVRGKDAEDFLHRVTAGRVRGLPVGGGRPGLLLNGQSRMVAQFDLLRLESGLYWLVSPAACARELAAELERLHFGESLEVHLTEGRAGVGEAPGAERAPNGEFAVHREKGACAWPSPVRGFQCSTALAGFPDDWEFARIGALVPWPPADWNGSTPALEAGALPWIDRGKGCYPGQEVVELSLNVGHPARVLVAWEGRHPVRAGQAIELAPGGRAAGIVTSAAENGAGTRALVRVPWAAREQVPQGWVRLRSQW